MFRFDAFGQRIICKPRLMFKDGGGSGGGGGGETDQDKAARLAAEAAAFLKDNGFPKDTKVDDMEPLQQAAYWRDMSKKQQKLAEGKADPDDLKAAQDELAELKKNQLSDQDKALETAREVARREGENIGSEKYLRAAVTAKFQLLTGKKDDEIETIFGVVDPKQFLDDKGEIIAAKLEAYAATFGAADESAGKEKDPVAAALARTRAAGGGKRSSISEKRKEVRESMSPTKA